MPEREDDSGIAGDGGTLYYQYDDLQRLTHSYALNGGSGVEYSYMEYDVDNRVTKMGPGANAPFFCTWAYDAATSRLTHRVFGWENGFQSPLSKVDFSYDRPGRLTKMDKGLVQWQYQYASDGAQQLTAIRVTNAYGLDKTTSFAMDAYGRTVTRTLGNGVYTTYQYDDSGALTRMAHQGLDGGSRSLAYTYQYDKNDNCTKVSLADSTGALSSETAYTYDALNQLICEAHSGGSANYTKFYAFDSVGNRTALTHVDANRTVTKVTTYSYNAGEELTALTRTTNGTVDQNRTYSYDAAGQLTQMADVAAGVTKTFLWDTMGRMTHADINDGTAKLVDYGYNPVGKRYLRAESGVTKTWTYQGENVASVESLTSPTVHTVYTVHGLGSGDGAGGGGCGSGGGAGNINGGPQIANVYERDDVNTRNSTTASRFYLYNHRGDVIGVSDSSGNLTSAYEYDAYGAISQSYNREGGSAPTDDILLTGKDYDALTALYYFNARWYDPDPGVFLSAAQKSPDSEHPYSLCNSNPVGRVDPSGADFTDSVQTAICLGCIAVMSVIYGLGGAMGICAGVCLDPPTVPPFTLPPSNPKQTECPNSPTPTPTPNPTPTPTPRPSPRPRPNPTPKTKIPRVPIVIPEGPIPIPLPEMIPIEL